VLKFCNVLITWVLTVNTVPTVSDTKRSFQRAFPKPVNPVYRRAIDELLVETHLLIVNQAFRYDAIFALGFVTSFDRFTVGYRPERDRSLIFSALVSALQFDPASLRHDAEQLQSLAQQQPAQVITLLTTAHSELHLEPLSTQIRAIASNPQFKYSRLFAVGLFTLLETADLNAWQDSDRRKALLQSVSEALKISGEKLQRDLEVYQSSLEKLQQSLQMMADLVEAERKKREKQPSLVSTAQPSSSN
jgi:photosystem II biogenesis protein Psp29